MLRPVCALGRYVYRTYTLHFGFILAACWCYIWYHFNFSSHFVVFPSHSSILCSINCKAHNFTMAEAEQEHKRLFDERVGTLIENKKSCLHI